MTEQDKDAIIGKAHRELRDIREKLAALRARAHELGDSFDTAAYHLRNRLEYFRLQGEGTDGRFVEQEPQYRGSFDRQPHTPKLETLDIKAILALRDEIRACLIEEQRLEETLQNMGFKNR